MRRRDFLGTAAFAPAMLSATEPLSPGQRFNESVEFRDSVTGHPSRRLTTKRRFNQKSTYTQNACFSADSRRMVMSTEDAAGNSALLTGEVETGDIRVIAVSTRIKDTPQKPDINGNNICLNQAGNWAAAAVGGSIRVWDLESMAEKVLYIAPNEHIELGHPIGSIDGKPCTSQCRLLRFRRMTGRPGGTRSRLSTARRPILSRQTSRPGGRVCFTVRQTPAAIT